LYARLFLFYPLLLFSVTSFVETLLGVVHAKRAWHKHLVRYFAACWRRCWRR